MPKNEPHVSDKGPLAIISTRIPHSIINRLESLSNRTGRTRSYYILQALQLHLTTIEKAYLKSGTDISIIKSNLMKELQD